ncbi:MAG TPA: hypothetical protein PKW35_09965 [Nannocystaceae bacterium]|nr:hypothetical protein [Nannocystaceae bacterium]
MTRRAAFAATALATSLVNLLLHAASYALILKDFYAAHPAGSPGFVRELHRSADEIVVWAMVVTALSMGTFITLVMHWSGAATPGAGIKKGALLGALFWIAVNSGLYASSRLFSLESVLVDTPCSALTMASSAAFAAWMLHRLRGGER